MAPENPRPVLGIAILAMGGEGGGVLADWIVDLAEHEGYHAQSTSVPGVAQRTGATIYYVEIAARRTEPGHEPVLALMPVPGDVDIVVASELMEAGRAIQRGLVTPERTVLIASTHRVYSIAERCAPGDGRVPSRPLLQAGEAAARRFIHADFARLAAEAGSVISAAFLGALAASGALPFARERFEEAIRRGTVGVDQSLRAFALGHAQVTGDGSVPGGADEEGAPSPGPALALAVERASQAFPSMLQPTLSAALVRLAQFQDVRYADEYLDRLAPIEALDAAHGDGTFRLTRETARYLALAMTYEDAIRVAQLKIRRRRFERVAHEVGASDHQLLEIDEFLHPRIEEVADVLPEAIGRRLLASQISRRLVNRARIVRSSSIRGFLQLYLVASLVRWRRRSLRFKAEQARISAWLATIASTAPFDYELAIAVAECQVLLKGYGETLRHSRDAYDSVLASLTNLRKEPDPAAVLRSLTAAALEDANAARPAALTPTRARSPTGDCANRSRARETERST